MPPKKEPGLQISWTTITYRSVLMVLLVILVLAGMVTYMVFPEQTRSSMSALGSWIQRVTAGWGSGQADTGTAGSQQANFTQIDGTVRVKKANSNTWVAADYSLPLDRGDVVQTGSEGMAKVVFVDGTSYTVKPDSLIVVEQNSTNAAQQTQVAVQVTTGTVDLTTPTQVQGSKSQVIVAGATATLAPESAAQVRNDPRAERSEILVTRGSGQVARGQEVVQLSDYEKVSFKFDDAAMAKVKEVRPPTLIAPANMAPIFAGSSGAALEFTWTPVDNARSYYLRVARNPYFSSLVHERRVNSTNLRLGGLGEGPYYWTVQAVDPNGRESIESEKNRFTVIPKGASEVALALELDPFVQHGHVIEVRGRTEPSARVMVNGQEVPVVSADGSFRFFTPPLPSGVSVITVTAQNAKGGVNTQQKRVVIQ